MIKIRLSRGGKPNKPVYTIVATDSRNARNGEKLEKLGQYNPNPVDGQYLKDIKTDSISTWVKKGAILSDTVRTLFKKHKIEIK